MPMSERWVSGRAYTRAIRWKGWLLMGPLISVVLVVALMWVAWRLSPRRRMIRNRAAGEMTAGGSASGVPANLNADLAIVEQRARDGGAIGGGGIGGMGI